MSNAWVLVEKEGTTGILKGVGPTLLGSSFQGMVKRSQPSTKGQYGWQLRLLRKPPRTSHFVLSKVKIQTSPSGTFPTSFGAALARLMRDLKIETRYPFGSLVPFWSRQIAFHPYIREFWIPHTMAKFYIFFESIVQLFYTHDFTEPKDNYSKPTQLGITFASGCIAGVVSALVSHPADSLVLLQGRVENEGKSIGKTVEEVSLVSLQGRVENEGKSIGKIVEEVSLVSLQGRVENEGKSIGKTVEEFSLISLQGRVENEGKSIGKIVEEVSLVSLQGRVENEGKSIGKTVEEVSLVSLQGRVENEGKSIGKIVEELGFTRLMTKGLGTRFIMFGTLTEFQ
ncbi:hypothetical protein K435DRAFT_805177 [Dendrothele bispora CBS 962.96]|uniref:Mitochondrial carrier n=1 Tax=Dendrothele bispora (strain CBS 962.96) TaxID=1314807 RepID=A0A4S8LBR0_DENBC|nr:hypothetical protein K435DRAFT_805177 [Dendrothele bispora CBS 962.96]